MVADINPEAMASLLNGDHGAPYEILGPQPGDNGSVSIRAYQPGLERMTVVNDATSERFEMPRVRAEGFFEVSIPGKLPDLRYHYEAHTHLGEDTSFHDPYA